MRRLAGPGRHFECPLARTPRRTPSILESPSIPVPPVSKPSRRRATNRAEQHGLAALPALVALVLALPVAAHDRATGPGAAAQAPTAETAPAPAAVGSEPAGGDALDPGELFVNANAAYEAADHEKAIRLYSRLLEEGFENGRLLYNLGNAYLRNGELGSAIACYRASRRLLPRDQDVRANLAFARKSTKDAISPPEPSALLSTLFFWHYGLSPSELTATVLLLNVLFWGLWTVRIFRWDSELLRWLFILLLVLLVATGASLVGHRLFSTQVAVILPQQIGAHTAPDPDSVVRFKLHAGTEVEVEDRRVGWLRIRLPDGQQGWIDAAWAEVVKG